MLFLLDENVHIGVGAFLQGKGHDAARVPSGIKNGEVINLACAQNRVLVTHDKDFLKPARRYPSGFPGVICVRIHPPTFSAVSEALAKLLLGKPELTGGVFALDESGFRRI